MPRARQVKITKDGEEAFVLQESVKAYERHGWTAADDGSSDEEEAVTEYPLETQAAEVAGEPVVTDTGVETPPAKKRKAD